MLYQLLWSMEKKHKTLTKTAIDVKRNLHWLGRWLCQRHMDRQSSRLYDRQ